MKNNKIAIIIWASVISFVLGVCPVAAQGTVGVATTDLPEAVPGLQQKETGGLAEEFTMKAPIDFKDELPLGDASNYTLGVDDVIEISVLRHPEVSGEYVINNEGKIQYEFVGDVQAVGLTKDELQNRLASLLKKFIIAPEVTVKITGYNSKVVYVIGEVYQPGKIFMRGDTITVREALVQSGLPTLGASTKKCRLITPNDSGETDITYVNVFNLLYEGDLRENLVMKPGDTLYIPATVMTKAMRVIAPVAQPVSTAAGAGRMAVTGF